MKTIAIPFVVPTWLTNIVLSVIPYEESARGIGYELSICVKKNPRNEG
jgi:hypothetical protein